MVQNFTNNTNLTSLDDWPEGAMRGDPIILHFEPEFEEGQRGVSETEFTSTMVEVSNLYWEKKLKVTLVEFYVVVDYLVRNWI